MQIKKYNTVPVLAVVNQSKTTQLTQTPNRLWERLWEAGSDHRPRVEAVCHETILI